MKIDRFFIISYLIDLYDIYFKTTINYETITEFYIYYLKYLLFNYYNHKNLYKNKYTLSRFTKKLN